MKRGLFGRLLGFAVIVLVGGCVTLDEPLSDIMEAKADEALCGVWKHQGDDGTVSVSFVGLKPAEPGAPQGLLSVSLPSFDKEKKTVESTEQMTAFVTRIKDATYLNIVSTEPATTGPIARDLNLSTAEGYKAWKARDTHPVTLVKYQVRGEQLLVWLGDKDKASEWETGGAMREKYGKSPKALVSFIEKEGDATLFPPDKKEVYTRVK